MRQVMFDIPTRANVRRVVITRETITEEAEPSDDPAPRPDNA